MSRKRTEERVFRCVTNAVLKAMHILDNMGSIDAMDKKCTDSSIDLL